MSTIARKIILLPVLILFGAGAFLLWCQPAVPLQPDADLHSGYLPDGTAYFIRPTEEPSDRLAFRLLVAVGSAMETAGQKGYAHFVEHLAFNGLQSWPGRSLDDFLNTIDPEMDLESNAYTGGDSTIFLIELPLSLTNNLDTGIKILHEWTYGLSFDPAEVELEKGVILGELREYANPEDQLIIAEDKALYRNSRYYDVDPLGTAASVLAATPDGLRAFYEQWYRPELMAVIISGPVNPRKAQALLQKTFSAGAGRVSAGMPEPAAGAALAAGAAPAGNRLAAAETGVALPSAQTNPPTAETRSHPVAPPGRFTAPDQLPETMRAVLSTGNLPGRSRLRLLFSAPRPPLRSTADYEQRLREYATAYALSLRLRGLSASGKRDWHFVDCYNYTDYGNNNTLVIEVSCARGKEAAVLSDLALELARFRQHGATPLEREYASGQAIYDLPYYSPDAYDLTDEIEAAFLWNGIVPNRQQIEKLEQNLVDAIDYGRAAALGTLQTDLPPFERGVLSLRSDAANLNPAQLAAHWTNSWPGAVEQARQETSPQLQPAEPSPDVALFAGDRNNRAHSGSSNLSSRPASRKESPIADDLLVFPNGIQVHLLADDSADETVSLVAWSPGGSSAEAAAAGQAHPTSAIAALALPGVMLRAGISGISDKMLEHFITSNNIDWEIEVDRWHEYIRLDGPRNKFGELLGLLRACFTRLPEDDVILQRAILHYAEDLYDRQTQAENRLQAAADQRDGGLADEAQALAVAALSPADLRAAWRSRFGNAADFSFIVYGDFSATTAIPMIQEQLGTLPASTEREHLARWNRLQPQTVTLNSSGLSYAASEIRWIVPLAAGPDKAALEGIAAVLEESLFVRIREELSATYNVDCWLDFPHPVQNICELVITFRMESGAGHLIPEVLAVVEQLQHSGGLYKSYEFAWKQYQAALDESTGDRVETMLQTLHGYARSDETGFVVADMVNLARQWLQPGQASILTIQP
ncbi:MAG: insulinase family protein [Spirochaetes bacterium]|nr:insulinase family protein [Spirochaetota bacterium]